MILLPLIVAAAAAVPIQTKNPDNWCEGIDARIAHLQAYRRAQLAGLALVQPGSTVTYEISEAEAGQATLRYREVWTVVAAGSDAIDVDVSKQTGSGFSYREHRRIVPQVLGDKFAYDPSRPESCGEAFVFAHEYEKSRATIGGQAVESLARHQLNVAHADFEQAVSPQVPFGLVSERLSMEKQGHILERRTALVDFRSPAQAQSKPE